MQEMLQMLAPVYMQPTVQGALNRLITPNCSSSYWLFAANHPLYNTLPTPFAATVALDQIKASVCLGHKGVTRCSVMQCI